MATQSNPELGHAIGDNLALRIGQTIKFYKITNRDNIFLLSEEDAIAADSTSSYAEVTNLNPPHGQLYFIYALWIDGNVKVFMKQPASTNLFGTQRSPAGGLLTDRSSGVKGSMNLDLYFTIDNPPSVQIQNEQPIEITPKIWYIGWRYSIEELPGIPTNYDQVSITGLAQ